MSTDSPARWRPETDPDYGQILVRHLLVKYRWTLVAGLVAGAMAALVISLFIPPSYSSSSTIIVDKGVSSMSGMLGGLALLGGGNSALENEIQVIESREIAKEVVDELGLQVEVVDWNSPDMSHNRVLSKIGLARRFSAPREDIYRRLRISDVEVSPDMLDEFEFDLVGTDGGWKTSGKSGDADQPVSFDAVSFTPVFGSSHQPGDKYRLVALPDWDAVADFQGRLSATAISDTANVVTISFRHRNPFICREVVDLVTAKYLARYEQMELGDYDIILHYIAAEIADAELRVNEIVGRLDEYREENRIYEPTAQATSAIEMMSQLSIMQGQNEIQLRQIENLISNMDSRPAEEISQVIQSPVNPLPIDQTLTERLASYVTTLDGLQQTHTDSHPEVIRLKSNIDVVLGQIRESLQASASQLKLANRRLGSDIGTQRSQLIELPAAESQVALLTSELQVNGEILAMLKKSEAETKLLREETTTDVSLLDSAQVPIKPSSPRLGKNALLGALAGLIIAVLLGLLLESGDQRVASIREFRAGLGVPLLGVLGNSKGNSNAGGGATGPGQADVLADSLGINGRCTGLIHPCGPAGGFSLAAGLAATATASDQVLLVDADLQNHGLVTALDQDAATGLAEIAESQSATDESLVSLGDGRWLLGPGKAKLDQRKAVTALQLLAGRFPSRLVCLPAPGQWQNLAELVKSLDQLVLVVPQAGCSRQQLREAAAALADAGIRPAGFVVTGFSAARDPLGRSELKLAGLA